MKYILTLMTFVSLLSCNNVKTDVTTEIFAHYLQEVCSCKIPEATHYFLLLPSLYCRGCVQDKWQELEKWGNHGNRKDITIVTVQPQSIPNTIVESFNVVVDDKAMMNRLPLQVANLTIVKCEMAKVLSIYAIPTVNSPPIKDLLK